MTFTKLFSSITESTVWCEDSDTRVVWITMLAMSNKNGFVFGSEPGLASRAKVSLEATIAALDKFQKPDKYSRSKEHEGRRIEVVDGGWRLLNYLKHRSIRDEEERKEYMKAYMRDYRKQSVNNVSKVSRRKPPLAQAEAEAEAVKSKPSPSAVEEIYELYPKKVGKRIALKSIEAAIKRVVNGEYKNVKRSETEAIAGIKNRTVMFAQSAAGARGQYTPHPATWFNRSGYLDDPKEWDCEEPVTATGPTKSEQRLNHNRAAIASGFGIAGNTRSNDAGIQDGNTAGRGSSLEKLLLE